MSFSLYRLEGEECMSVCITTQIKPLWALFQLRVPAAVNLLSLQVCEVLGSLKPQHVSLSGSTRDSEHIHSCLSTGLALPALQVSWVGCHTYFHLPSLRLLSVSDKIVLVFLQIHGTLVTSSDRFCWKVFFLLEWWERNAGTLLISLSRISRWIWTEAGNWTPKPYTIDCFKAVGICFRFFNI